MSGWDKFMQLMSMPVFTYVKIETDTPEEDRLMKRMLADGKSPQEIANTFLAMDKGNKQITKDVEWKLLK